MRVLFISHEANPSGAPAAFLHIVRKLFDSVENLEAEVLLLKGGALEDEFGKMCNTVVCDNSEPFFHKVLRKLRLASEWKPDYVNQLRNRSFNLIYANTVATLQIAMEMKKKFGSPILVHIHEAEYLMNLLKTSASMLADCDAFIVVSELCKRALVEKYNVPGNKITVQHPVSPWAGPIISGDYKASPVRLANVQEGEFVIGVSSATYWLKSDDLVPLIAKRFFDKYPEANCRFVSIGLCDEAFNRIYFDLEKAGVKDRVSVVGRVNNPLDYYSRFDAVMVPSREESFSLVAEECALLGKPVVFFGGAIGISDWLDDTSSVQVPYLDIESFVDKLYNLCSDKRYCEKIGNAARNVIRERCLDEMKIQNIINTIRKFEK